MVCTLKPAQIDETRDSKQGEGGAAIYAFAVEVGLGHVIMSELIGVGLPKVWPGTAALFAHAAFTAHSKFTFFSFRGVKFCISFSKYMSK